jgi:LDH2 family malate/lactate/ureidoglycolate dehydrogenase
LNNPATPAQTFVMPVEMHNAIVAAAYRARGYGADEANAAAQVGAEAARHGIKTHNAIKALHLDEHFGSKADGCKPGAKIEKLPSKFKAVQRWNANRKLGQAVAVEAMNECMRMADEFGVGVVSVDNAFHYLWGGGYVIEAARKGYIAYTNCTAALAEVVPFGGKFPTLGTNPHSWGFPTQDAIAGEFAKGRSQQDNVNAVIKDILGHGNEKCMLPGQPEAEAAKKSAELGGLLFTAAEIDAFDAIAKEGGVTLDRSKLRVI